MKQASDYLTPDGRILVPLWHRVPADLKKMQANLLRDVEKAMANEAPEHIVRRADVSKLEDVARALSPGSFDSLPGHGDGECFDCDFNRSEARRLAAAAIAALRDPTPEMVDAGRKTLPLGLDSDDMAKKWRAMIDAALK